MRIALASALAGLSLVAPGASNGDAATPSPSTLLARHAPVVVLHPAERFSPVSVEGFLAESELEQRQPDGNWAVVPGPLPAAGGPWRLDQRLCDVREGLQAEECYATAQAAHDSTPTVYGTSFLRGKRIALQYWLFYPFNGYSPARPPSPEFAQLHEGDWEMITILLERSGKPLHAGYRRHCTGIRKDWRAVEKRGQRPVVYVALGSHGSYFSPGSFALDEKCWPKEALIVFDTYGKPLRDATQAGRTVRPRLVTFTATSPAWMRFPGTWGEDQIIDFPDARFTYGAGPVGPAFQKVWRRPVAEPLSWPKT